MAVGGRICIIHVPKGTYIINTFVRQDGDNGVSLWFMINGSTVLGGENYMLLTTSGSGLTNSCSITCDLETGVSLCLANQSGITFSVTDAKLIATKIK